MVCGASEELLSTLSGTAMTAVGAPLGAPASLMVCASIKSSFQLTTKSVQEAGARSGAAPHFCGVLGL